MFYFDIFHTYMYIYIYMSSILIIFTPITPSCLPFYSAGCLLPTLSLFSFSFCLNLDSPHYHWHVSWYCIFTDGVVSSLACHLVVFCLHWQVNWWCCHYAVLMQFLFRKPFLCRNILR